jgi:pyrroline-5-carboxylate reductase
VLAEIAPAVSPAHTLLSVAAGMTTAFIESHLPDGARVVRAMPNTPALIGEGIAGLSPGRSATDEDLGLAEEALGHVGQVVRLQEKDLDAVTALSGSGPAYFALLTEAMIEAGLLLGLSRDVATRLVVQTMLGSARLLRDEKMHPVELRESVTSPGGTTTRAIRELERSGVRAAFLNAINAATERSRELGADHD